jgi:putative transposase
MVVNMIQRRHSTAEIEALLDRADAMSADGRLQGDIAKALGVSVMTYHRWRKARAPSRLGVGSRHGAELKASPLDQAARISDLQLENLRLRRLVTDLLLEKMNLEESDHGRAGKNGARL